MSFAMTDVLLLLSEGSETDNHVVVAVVVVVIAPSGVSQEQMRSLNRGTTGPLRGEAFWIRSWCLVQLCDGVLNVAVGLVPMNLSMKKCERKR